MNKLPILAFLIFLFLMPQYQYAQNIATIEQQQVWTRATLRLKVNNKLSVNLRAEERSFVFPFREHHRILPELFIAKVFSPSWSATAGGMIFTIFLPSTAFDQSARKINELRPYLRVMRCFSRADHRLSLQLNTELRILKYHSMKRSHFDGPVDAILLRPRLRVEYEYRLSPDVRVALSEEILVNAVSAEGFGFFDQNRLSATLRMSPSEKCQTNFGYLHWFQPSPETATYFSRHNVVLDILYSIGV